MLWRSQWRAEGVVIVAMIVAYLLFITNTALRFTNGAALFIWVTTYCSSITVSALPLHFAARKLKGYSFLIRALSVLHADCDGG